ncbi:MAG: hypothetical protein NT023_10425 [Armatimonadetes bacterium]|nr:hypothetical protein [Armatimonadota bacterium]
MTPNLFPPQSAPFPNHLLDVEMPRLSDTEWRVLCVLVRQTLGWRDEVVGSRKLRDWLTHSQLKKRTGRESAAVSRAVQSLLTKRLIVVEDSEGQALITPQQRQRQLGRLYFCLHSRLLPQADSGANVSLASSHFENADARMERMLAKSENTKAKTTKETVYKTTPPSPSTNKNPRMEETIQSFLSLYQKLFQQRSPKNLPSPFSENKEGKLIRQLLVQYPIETLCDLLELFFALEDKWVREQGYSLTAFRHRLPKLLMHPTHVATPITTKSSRWSKVEMLLPYANQPQTNPKGGV